MRCVVVEVPAELREEFMVVMEEMRLRREVSARARDRAKA